MSRPCGRIDAEGMYCLSCGRGRTWFMRLIDYIRGKKYTREPCPWSDEVGTYTPDSP